jgi:hypothetical protein
MALLIAVWAGIGFSVIAVSVADRKMEEKARLCGVPLTPEDWFRTLILVALASASVFAVVTYNVLK